MKTKLLYIVAILFVAQAFGQRKYAANQYFKEFAYKKSAELYEQIYKKGDSSKLVLERLGDSYYFNTLAEQSEIWYAKLIKNYQDEVKPEYYFRYAQSLKSNGNYEASDAMMKKFRSLKPSDSRHSAISEKSNYKSLYSSLENKLISLHNVSTNTRFSDFGAFLIDDDFYFSSSSPKSSSRNRIYKWNNQPFLDIYKATKDEQNLDDVTSSVVLELREKENISDKINTRYHEATAIITKDKQTMYFTRDNFDGRRRGVDKERTTNLKLYKSTLENGEWTKGIELPFNSDDFSTGHPALSPDEKTLYFVSDREGGIGSTDIYKVSVDGDKYGDPVNLGDLINTEGREMFPYVNENNILYFSSDGHLGLGALDIFESNIEGTTFSKPENLEAPFNSKKDDFAFIINKEADQGFFSSNREGGKGDDDIYSFIVDKTPPKPCMQSITGIVKDIKSGSVIAMAIVKLIDAEGKVINSVQSDAEGLFNFENVPCKTTFTVLGEKMNYSSDQNEVSTTEIEDAIQKTNLALTPLIVNDEIVINPIFFDFDKFNIREEATYELEKIITVLNNNPNMVIKIESHTDSRATKAYNRRLSTNRAKSTRDYILSRGISSNRIQSAIGYGESQLLNNCDDANKDNCTEEQHQRNRRSKFIIVSGGKNVKVNNPEDVQLKKIDPKPGRN